MLHDVCACVCVYKQSEYQMSPSVVLLQERNFYLILVLYMCLHQIIYIFIEMNSCFVLFFPLKADYYSKPGRRVSTEMNKVFDEAERELLWLLAAVGIQHGSIHAVVWKLDPCRVCSEFMLGRGGDLTLSLSAYSHKETLQNSKSYELSKRNSWAMCLSYVSFILYINVSLLVEYYNRLCRDAKQFFSNKHMLSHLI